jgi:hypothetical protein
MFVVTDADAAAIRAAFEQSGEFAAAIELRRRFPGITEQRAGAGVRPHHRRLEAAAAASGEASAVVTAGAVMPRPRLPALAQLWQRSEGSRSAALPSSSARACRQ